MTPGAVDHNPHSIEAEVAALWRARRLPAAGGVLGPPNGPIVRQIEGFWSPADYASQVAQRAVEADVDARYLSLAGRRAQGTLRRVESAASDAPSTVPPLLVALGVWTGGDGKSPWDSADRVPGVQAIVSRLAAKGILLTRDESFRVCPTCGALRSPERIVYDEKAGDTYLIRFPIRFKELTVHALVWVDAPWKLLGASALLVNPTARYVIAGYRRREDRELILCSATALERLRRWIPDSTLEVVEEHPGRDFEGIPYTYPLRHEFPMGGDLAPPAGTILGAADVGDSGTGIVPLVPGHGPTDARIADRLGVSGWPLLTPRGRLDFTLMHKYAGLDLETADEFVLRDLSEAGALLARLRVKRGVPYCALCGTALLWTPARTWCFEPSRLPPERRAAFGRLLPKEAFPGPGEVAPWPVSEAVPSDAASAVTLLECARCERLDRPDGDTHCPCGGQRVPVRRKLLSSFESAVVSWARLDPFPEGDSVHFYLGHRRRVPALLHNLVASSGVEGTVGDLDLSVAPTVTVPEVADLVTAYGADAVRCAMVRCTVFESTVRRFSDQCRREGERLRRLWSLAGDVLARCDPAMVATFARPLGGSLEELELEDRAIVACWERARVLALSHYDQSASGLAYRRITHFLDNDLAEYREIVEPRLSLTGSPSTKRGALRTLFHVLRGASETLAAIAPFTSESVHRSLSADRTSLFEQPLAGLDRSLLNDDLVAAWSRWRAVMRSVQRFRRSYGIARTTPIPSLVLTAAADDVGDRLRGEKETLARLTRATRLEVGSPREPWRGRQRLMKPAESEIQKVYPTQASQIVHLLQHMPPRRAPGSPEELSVVINGYPVRILPGMVTFVDTLPERVVPVPWSLGEMYAELPAGSDASRSGIPPLSSDAFWLVYRLERRLRAEPAVPGATRVAIVTAKDPLATELRTSADALARYLGLGEFRVVDRSEEAVPPNALTGRSRTGERWWVHVPGLPAVTPAAKRLAPARRLRRVSVRTLTVAAEEVDYADERVVAHEEAVRALGQELDGIVGVPLLGPAKISSAWELGLHSVDDYRHASVETVASLPGFGGPVAELVLSKLASPVGARAAQGTRPPEARPVPEGPKAEAPPAVAPPPQLGPAVSASRVPAELPPAPVPTPAESVLPTFSTETSVKEKAPEPPAPAEEPAVPVESSAPEFVAPEPSPEPVPPVPSPVLEPPKNETPGPPEPPLLEPIASETTEGLPPTEAPPPEAELAPPQPLPEPETTEEVPLPEEPTTPMIPTPPAETEPARTEEAPPAGEATPPTTPPTIGETEAKPPEGAVPPEETSPTVVPVPPAEEEPTPIAEPAEVGSSGPPAPQPPEEAGSEVPSAEVLTPGSMPVPEAPPGEVPAEDSGKPIPEEETAPPEAPPEPAPSSPSAEIGSAEPVVVPTPAETIPPPSETGEVGATGEESAATPPREPETVTEPELAAAPTPVPPAAPPEPVAPPSGVELCVGEPLTVALAGFLDSTAAGHRGVCLVRESPERIRARVGSRPIEVYWLTNIGRGPSIRPADLDAVWTLLGRKLLEDRATAFFLEGIEYLVRIHGAEAVLSGLVQFDRLARENDARVWVFLTPAVMRPGDLEQFQSTFGGRAPTP